MRLAELASSAAPALVALSFGGGLLPGLALANKAAFTSFTEARPELQAATKGSLAGSAPLRCSPLLAYPAPVLLDDVIDALARVESPDDLSCLNQEADGRLVRRAEFISSLEQLRPPTQQLQDANGKLLGLSPQVLSHGARAESITAAPAALAVDAIWAALSGGAPYVSPQEIQRCLARWRPTPSVFDITDFERSLLQGRAIVSCGYIVLFTLQALALALFIVQPVVEKLSE